MIKFLLAGIKNWQTTLLGVVAGVSHLIMNADRLLSEDKSDVAKLVLEAIGFVVGGFIVKDANKTGVAEVKNKK